MVKHRKLFARQLLLTVSAIVLILLACSCASGATMDNTGSSAFTDVTPLPDAHTYNGSGYTINYPKNWQLFDYSQDDVHFGPNDVHTELYIQKPKYSQLTPEAILGNALAIYLGNKDKSANAVFSEVTIGGEIWKRAETKSIPYLNIETKGVVLVAVHKNTAFVISYYSYSDTFDKDSKSYFEPMLQSFQFD